MLRHHRSVLLAVLVAAFLVGLAAASAPFVRSAAASAALKNKLDEFTPFATGLHLRARTGARPGLSEARLVREAAAREEAFRRLGRELGLAAPPVAAIFDGPDQRVLASRVHAAGGCSRAPARPATSGSSRRSAATGS